MPVMLLSNPLGIAVYGNPKRARRKTRKPKKGFKSRKRYTQARWKAKHRVGRVGKVRGGRRYKITKVVRIRGRRGSPRRHDRRVPWSGRLGGIVYRAKARRVGKAWSKPFTITNPRNRAMARHRRRSRRRNPIVKDYISAAKSAPGSVVALFKGKNKIKNLGFAAGGAVGTYVLGGLLSSFVITPALNKVPAVAGIVANPIAKRVIGGLIPFTAGFVASRFIKGDLGKALLVGGTVAGLTEMAMPGMVGQLIGRIPGVGSTLVGIAAKAPSQAAAVAATGSKAAAAATQGSVKGLEGLGEYVDAASYQGTGEYVDAASYQGTGEYVDAASYQGTGDDSLMLAGPEDVLASDDAMADDTALAGYLTDKPYLDQPSYVN